MSSSKRDRAERSRSFGLTVARGDSLTVGLIVALLGGLSAGGCVEIDGGAVEVPWTVFAADGRGAINDCSCTEPAITSIRLKLTPADPAAPPTDPCATAASCRFACDRKTGATSFMIPPGAYLMSIEPEGADGAPLDAGVVMVPAPMVRQVARGAPTELDALEVVAPCAASCHGADVEQPCAR